MAVWTPLSAPLFFISFFDKSTTYLQIRLGKCIYSRIWYLWIDNDNGLITWLSSLFFFFFRVGGWGFVFRLMFAERRLSQYELRYGLIATLVDELGMSAWPKNRLL